MFIEINTHCGTLFPVVFFSSIAASRRWNNLSLDIKLRLPVDIFKVRLKAFLFKQCYRLSSLCIFNWFLCLQTAMIIFDASIIFFKLICKAPWGGLLDLKNPFYVSNKAVTFWATNDTNSGNAGSTSLFLSSSVDVCSVTCLALNPFLASSFTSSFLQSRDVSKLHKSS